MKKALITGVNGQDGSYLAEFLINKGYEVHGLIRRTAHPNTEFIEPLLDKLILHLGDMADYTSILNIISSVRPNEIYNLAAQSHVHVSFAIPVYTADIDAIGPMRILEAVRAAGLVKSCKIYQASTSELYGKVREIPQNELTPFHPRSPYGVAKQCAYWAVVNYREAYEMFAVNGILFNHESERRGHEFVTRKISLGVAKIANNRQEILTLGNLNAKRDWGYAKDYVECMWLMLQHKDPEDFVIATGVFYTIRDFVNFAFKEIGVDLIWSGEGVDEIGRDSRTNKILVNVSPEFYRPSEVEQLLGDPSKAQNLLGWDPNRTSLKELVHIMVAHDLGSFNKL
jgi:GDPmannose 4,6-dehydratase